MKNLILFLILILLVVVGGILVYLYIENQKPIVSSPVDTNLKVNGLVPFEQWQEQNQSQYKIKE